MFNVILVTEGFLTSDIIKKCLIEPDDVEYTTTYNLYIKSIRHGSIVFYYDQQIIDDFDEEEKVFISDLENPSFYYVSFHNIQFFKQILCCLATTHTYYFDNDHGSIIDSSTVVDGINSNPEWDLGISVSL